MTLCKLQTLDTLKTLTLTTSCLVAVTSPAMAFNAHSGTGQHVGSQPTVIRTQPAMVSLNRAQPIRLRGVQPLQRPVYTASHYQGQSVPQLRAHGSHGAHVTRNHTNFKHPLRRISNKQSRYGHQAHGTSNQRHPGPTPPTGPNQRLLATHAPRAQNIIPLRKAPTPNRAPNNTPLQERGAPSRVTHVAPNTETDILRRQTSHAPFKISIDGQAIAGGGFEYESGQRATDKALAATNIQIKSNGLDVVPMLNIGLQNDAVSVARGETMTFVPYMNYRSFVERGEVRVFREGQSTDDVPLAIIPLNPHGVADLPVGAALPDALFYQLRVYDKDGRYDETSPRSVTITDSPKADPSTIERRDATWATYGIDRTLSRNINIKGAAITVYGQNIPPHHRPFVSGHPVPVDPSRNFVMQEILPYGDHTVKVSVLGPDQQGVRFNRHVHLKDTEFFYVALGDITLGQRDAIGPSNLASVSDEEFNDVVVNGRAAFYLKGKVKGEYLITAAMDTGEERLSDLLSNLDEKDPRQLLRRLDSDKFYPVYGDDSYTREGAPTQGKFYVRVDKDDSHIMWGNFATHITGTDYAQLDRGLYGGVADFNSDATTSFGERKTEATLFAADPGTIPGRDLFRGTGGSVYFLNRQDLSVGSERVRIDILDKDTGRVVETRHLKPYEDYDIDYIQGRVVLSTPLQSTVSDNQLVRTGSLSGNETQLVVRYEYTPSLTDIDGYTLGGRGTHWLGNKFRMGVTAQSETTDTADQTLLGVDAVLRATNNTYIKAEYARTEGPGFEENTSTDGGFIFDDITTPGVAGQTAEAYKVEAAVDLADLREGLRGTLHAGYDFAGEGFSGLGQIGYGERERISAGLDISPTRTTEISVEAAQDTSSRRGIRRTAYADINQKIGERLSAGVGVRYDDYDDTTVAPGTLSENRLNRNGSRTDASAELRYDTGRDATFKAFAQGTVDRDGARQDNSRAGIGVDAQLTSRLGLSGEVSSGNGGLGANARLNFKRNESSEFYLGYALSTGRSDTGYNLERVTQGQQSTVTAGTRTRFNDALSVYGEEQFAQGEYGRELTHTYGVDFSPSDQWTLGASIENGTITDDINGDFERTAFSLSASRSGDGLRLATNVEGRFEDGVLQGRDRDRTTWLMRNTVAFDAGQNWELLARANFAISESDQTSFLDADYVEGVLAAAYRPIDNDRINGLLKYTYFEDLSPAQQVNAGNRNNLARQRSHILSADGIVDINKRLSLGGKVGFRSGEVALDRASDTFIKSDALLGIVRADYHVTRKWDVFAEGRVLSSSLADDARHGALVGVYRHMNDHVKLGAGYSFSKFSDNLTDFENEADGFFINMVGKF